MKDKVYHIYTSGEYILNNPTLHVEDTPWKVEKIIPAVDTFMQDSLLKDIRLLDVGGGAGLLLKRISEYLKEKEINVRKNAFDLSEEMLRMQKDNNPDMVACLEGNIEKTSFKEREIDLVLMIDVLEHVLDPVAALKELNRISKYVIFKVPMENNLLYNSLNILKRGGQRRDFFQRVGHVHYYNFREFEKQISSFVGEILYRNFTNDYKYMLSENYHRRLNMRDRVVCTIGNITYLVSPYLFSLLFPNSVVCLVKCK
jgi:ubiquinone/menaquinone biosynthesis C-methylase UbiE